MYHELTPYCSGITHVHVLIILFNVKEFFFPRVRNLLCIYLICVNEVATGKQEAVLMLEN